MSDAACVKCGGVVAPSRAKRGATLCVECKLDPERKPGPARTPDAATVERNYAMTRLGAGDYLLPSNDATILWRVCRYDEDDAQRQVWGYWRWGGTFADTEQVRATIAEAITMGDWSRWTFWAGPYRNRRDAVEAALTEIDRG